MSNKATKSKVTGEVKESGGIPDGFEDFKAASVYAKPTPKSKPIEKDPTVLQGVWFESFNAVNPTALWVFDAGKEPPKLMSSGHPFGAWGYKPGVDPKKCKPEDIWFFPPKAKLPSFFTSCGTWSFPLTKRDESVLNPEEAGFLHIGDATKKEALDVGGRWRLLCQRPGEDQPQTMMIHVKKPDGEKISLIVSPTDTIDDIKDKVKDKTGIPKDEQRLRHKGKPLDDKPTLEECGIQDGDTLKLDPMEIVVKHWDGKKYLLSVDPTNTIDQVKSLLEKQEKIPKKTQRLTFKGTPCEDAKTLRDQGIQHKSVLNLVPMQIQVKTPTGKTIPIDVNPSDTIDDIKDKIAEKTKIPKDDQRLQFKNKPLNNDKASLDDEGIQHGDTVDMEPMTIYVKDPKGKKFTLSNVDPDDTIDKIKDKLEKQEGIPKKNQRLVFKNKPCDDNKTLRDHGVKHKSVLDLEPMQIKVKTPSGKTVPLEVNPTDTIDDIKNKIAEKANIPKDDQRLQFKNKPLNNDKATLDDEGIQHGDTVDMEPMTIYVKDPKGKKFTLANVDPDDTIDKIKDKLEKQEGIPKKNQRLVFKNKPCDDNKTLRDHGVKHKSVLDLEPMQIKVKTPTGKTIPIDVNPTDTIDDIKDKIAEKANIPKDDQRLQFNNKPLDNDKATLDDEGIQHGDTVDMEPMTIYVKDPQGKKYTLDNVDPDDTIDKIKKKLEKQEKIPKSDQRLTFNDKPCDDNQTLRDLGVKHKSELSLQPMVVHVRTPQGTKLSFEVAPTDTIRKMKDRVLAKENIPVAEQRMAFGTKSLTKDNASLREVGIQHDDVIDLEPMHIIVKDWKNQKFTIPCDPDDTVDTIKDKIEKQEGHPKAIQFLTYGGKLLEDPESLRDAGIKHKDVINLDRMKIYVKDWKGKTYTLEVDPEEPVENVKQMIEKREGLPVHEQILQFNGQTLKEPQGLSDYGIKYKDTVHLSRQIPEVPKSPPTPTYTIQLGAYKSPFDADFTSPSKKGKKRVGVRASTKEQFKTRWHTDLASENLEMGLDTAKRHEEGQNGK